ncbi:sorbosone dehydrogenase family protein [Aeromicrobium sp. Root472D3]|uniref:PQQ-dependent sugar dehydrogenase n=1 Tax=Aeromicrobium sp. Root472D3 TaxID=1736540 RepID=UPI0006FC0677|nr:PQQ-dependent sugar dehydrogenase [Aeromicrobium sp. Root472D3]KQX75560.1 glucose sorbosone dehydrogenase [Aeromicrobium sp. Root472D3]
MDRRVVERRTFLSSLAVIGAAALVGCSRGGGGGPAPEPTTAGTASSPSASPVPSAPPTAGTPTVAGTVATGLNVPWGIAFLSTGDALVSQRDEGTIVRIATDGTVTELGAVPGSVGRPGGEGGLLGLAVAPGDDGTVFAYVTTSTDDRVVRMRLRGDRLGSPVEILTGIPVGSRHHGGRLLFDASGSLFVSTGDAGDGRLAQDRDSLAGKVLRIDTDGAAHPDNPFDNRTWSYGHRNIEGLALDADGRLWAAEFGDKSADELNLIRRGGNYGWPGVEGTGGGGALVDPLVTWAPDDASPAGIAITGSTAFIGALQGECLFAVPLDGETAGEPVAHLAGEHGRIRSVALAPDGALWVTTSNTDGRGDPSSGDDRILRVTV